MVTDALSAKEVQELKNRASKLAATEVSAIAEPKKRGGRTKKEPAEKA